MRKRYRRLTLEIAIEIWDCRTRHPDLYQDQIAAQLDINPGRVSEVLSGKRYPEARPRF